MGINFGRRYIKSNLAGIKFGGSQEILILADFSEFLVNPPNLPKFLPAKISFLKVINTFISLKNIFKIINFVIL